MAAVLRIISQRDYSQFPVFDGQEFRGLLTENGITRWLAQHVVRELSLIDLEDVLVSKLIQAEEQRPNWIFVSRNLSVDEAKLLFNEKKRLEAILITQNGNRTERLLGLITRWDVSTE